MLAREDADTAALLGGGGRQQSRGKTPVPGMGSRADGDRPARLAEMPAADLSDLIGQLTEQMHTAATELQFELAARLRDEIHDLKKELRGMQRAGHA
jgi:excinuclease ABC subunit B